jgi:hypothetical protein
MVTTAIGYGTGNAVPLMDAGSFRTGSDEEQSSWGRDVGARD